VSTREKESYSIQAVENALDVLEALSEEDEDVRISHLSEKLKMNKTSVFRLLATFENRGYVEREEVSGKYRLGLSAYEIGQKFLSRMALLRHARPLMERLSRGCNEAVYLAVRRRQETLFLDMVDTSQKVKIVPMVGKRFPLTQAAPGMALLAFSATGGNGKGSIDQENVREKLAVIRSQGYALSHDSLGEGIASAAVPLFGSSGKLHGVLCLVGPVFRLPEQLIIKEFLPQLLEASSIISSKLGWHAAYLPKPAL